MREPICPFNFEWGTADSHFECDYCTLWENCINNKFDKCKMVKLTNEQFIMVQSCIEFISTNKRIYSKEKEKTLKEVAEIFNAKYIEDSE